MDAYHWRPVATHAILPAPTNGFCQIAGKLIYIHERAMDVAVQPEFVPTGNDFLRHFQVPFSDLTHQVEADLCTTQLLKNCVNRQPRETGIQFTALDGIS